MSFSGSSFVISFDLLFFCSGDILTGSTFVVFGLFQLCDELEIPIFYNSRKHSYSSSGLKKQVVDNQNTPPLSGKTVKDNEVYTIVDNTELDALTVSTTTLHPSQETSGHSHPGIEEVYTFLSGTGVMQIDEEEFPAEKGKTFTIPDGSFHKVYNNSSDEDLLFICVFNKRRNH